ncbi:DUF4349 domain-containing protein [Diaphorobacter aerolatus]|uniref:DUF4349 domain-containing protein n=1 Tax=Diaphorobacter aerolatus TaxID=1288495 RepID=A0A7H0GMG1_9BURK|nr:DUF4349 domain-containing protein [Diaphorobacter aerolatus]QNP49477.1 DUF4349 domain-containing protein [Diaphorobacter aerolatus]
MISSVRAGVSARWQSLARAGFGVLVAGALLAACSPQDGNDSPAAVEVDARGAEQVAQMTQKMAAGGDVRRRMAEAVPAPAPAPASLTATSSPTSADEVQRFLAVRHHLQIEAPAADLAGLWGAVKARCEQLDCQVEASALQRETSHSAGSAYLTMRVNPRDFAMLTDALGSTAKVLQHQTSSEDKTGEVIDVEARIKNRTEYRDSLRELLRERDVKRKLSDLMEIRDTLSQVQAEIDAAQTQRKLLEKETVKQFVQMQFQPQRVVLSGTYSPWLQTWTGAWNALTGSAQTMVIGVAALLPWLVVLGVLLLPVWLLLRTWRARRRARVSAAAVAA